MAFYYDNNLQRISRKDGLLLIDRLARGTVVNRRMVQKMFIGSIRFFASLSPTVKKEPDLRLQIFDFLCCGLNHFGCIDAGCMRLEISHVKGGMVISREEMK